MTVSPQSDAAVYRTLFRQALLIRRIEERIIELYPSDRIQSPVHLSIGQEAVAVGTCAALQPQDLVFGTYRSHAFYVAKGGDLAQMFAELYGRIGGGCKGKAGSMHLAAPEVGFMGSSAVVSSTIPHAVGAAFAAKRRGTGQVCVAVMGDGALEEGVAAESLNFAALHKLPVLFVCENNGLAVHAPITTRQSFTPCGLAEAFAIPTRQVENGMDFMGIRSVIGDAVAQVRAGTGPYFVEVQTYRYREHVGPNEDFDAGYRCRSEYEAWRSRDPLVTDRVLAEELLPGINDEVEAAIAFAEASPLPGPEELLSDVW
jgi:pyruvate dehydrogenase E1 component alpha subunit